MRSLPAEQACIPLKEGRPLPRPVYTASPMQVTDLSKRHDVMFNVLLLDFLRDVAVIGDDDFYVRVVLSDALYEAPQFVVAQESLHRDGHQGADLPICSHKWGIDKDL